MHRHGPAECMCNKITLILRCVMELYYRLFCYLELEGLLYALNYKHLFALHYDKPRIQGALISSKRNGIIITSDPFRHIKYLCLVYWCCNCLMLLRYTSFNLLRRISHLSGTHAS